MLPDENARSLEFIMTRSALCERQMNAGNTTRGCAGRNRPVAMEISFQDEKEKAGENATPTSLQNAFLEFRQKRQQDIKLAKQMEQKAMELKCDPEQMLKLRQKFLERAKTYFGVPYAKRYHEPGTEFHDSPLFLDCCGLVRQVLRDLKEDFGFTIGPWNQAYMFDLLPVVIDEKEDMKPGDLVFISGTYFNPKSKAQRHDMVHVEIWLGEGEKTIGARWQKGVVQVHDSYMFKAKSYYNMQYHFRSIDTWLQGVCKSFCAQHAWRKSKFLPGHKSVFALLVESDASSEEGDEPPQDEAASDDEGWGPAEGDAVGDDLPKAAADRGSAAACQPAEEADQRVGHTADGSARRDGMADVSAGSPAPGEEDERQMAREFTIQAAKDQKMVDCEDTTPLNCTSRARQLGRAESPAKREDSPAWDTDRAARTEKATRGGPQSQSGAVSPAEREDSPAWAADQAARSGMQAARGGSQSQSGAVSPAKGEDSPAWAADQAARTEKEAARGQSCAVGCLVRPNHWRETSPVDQLTRETPSAVDTEGCPREEQELLADTDCSFVHERERLGTRTQLSQAEGVASVEDEDRVANCGQCIAFSGERSGQYFADNTREGRVECWSISCDRDKTSEAGWEIMTEAPLGPELTCEGYFGTSVKTRNTAGQKGGEGTEHITVATEQSYQGDEESNSEVLISVCGAHETLDISKSQRSPPAAGATCCATEEPCRAGSTELGPTPHQTALAACAGLVSEQCCAPRSECTGQRLHKEACQSPAIIACPTSGQTAGSQPRQTGAPAKPANEGRGRRSRAARTPGDRRRDNGEGKKDESPRRGRAGGLAPSISGRKPSFFLGGGNGNWMIEKTLYSLGWKRMDDKFDETFSLKWVESKSQINYNAFREGSQLVNHISNIGLLTTKIGLLSSLQEHDRVMEKTLSKTRVPLDDFLPETHRLGTSAEKARFVDEVYREGEVWICKPTGLNQGKGIYLVSGKDELVDKLGMRDDSRQAPVRRQSLSRPAQGRIIQRYIANPLLLNGCKFDVRAYMLIASTRPYVVLYHPGYVRLSCEPYTPYSGSSQGLHAHLTNQYVQKRHPLYSSLKEDTVWSFEKLQQYIDQNLAAQRDLPGDWVSGTFEKRMQRIMLLCFESVRQKLNRRVGFFDLLGFDFMVDENFKVWLLEINVNPALHTNCQVLMDTIPGVVDETLRIVLEIFEKTKKNRPIFPLQDLRSFRVLYNGEAKR